MNIMNKLTLRLLKENKRRTLVTIIGVIISVAMLTAVSTIAVSFIDLLKRQEIVDSGEWHALYKDIDTEQIETLAKDKTTKEIILSKDLGYATLKGSKNEDKPYVFIKSYDEKGFDNFPIDLIDGRLPTADNEIVISKAIEDNANVLWKIGDEIDLGIGNRVPFDDGLNDYVLNQDFSLEYNYDDGRVAEELVVDETKTFTVVGTIKRPRWESPWAPGYTILTHLDDTSTGVNASVIWNKVNNNQVEHATKLGNDIGIGEPTFNRILLSYSGVFGDTMHLALYSLAAIIMTIIIVGSVSLIFNAFAISVSERSRYLGMLASVGATKQQKRRSVYFEGIVIGAISIPLGILAGLGGIAVTFLFINNIIDEALGLTEKLAVVVTPISIIVACLVSILTIFISTYIPARRASRITAIDAIRQADDVKLTEKKVKTNRLVRKIFGIEAEFGLKNLKRNKKRYQITVFSLVVSIVLFLSVSYFTYSLKQSISLTQDSGNYDIEITKGNQTDQQWERLVAGTVALEDVTDSSINHYTFFQSRFDKADVPENNANSQIIYEDREKELEEANLVPNYVNVVAVDTDTLTAFAEDNKIDINKLTDKKKVSGILINEISYYSDDNKYVQAKALNKGLGDTISIFDMKDEEEYFVNDLDIVGVTTERPLGVAPAYVHEVTFIVSEQTYTQLSQPDAMMDETQLHLRSDDPKKTEEEIDEIREVAIHMYNHHDGRQADEQMILLLSVFTYGFIALITAISIANIFNTISTSIALRKREFAMLKSIGMTPKGFNKMINYESMFYGIKSLFYGLPLSIGVMYLMHRALSNAFMFKFSLPWFHIAFVVVAIFIIVGSAMLYSSSKIKKENIIDALKQENM